MASTPAKPGAYDLDGGKVCLMPRLTLSDLMYACGLVRTACLRADVMVLAARRHLVHVRALFGDREAAARFRFVDSWDSLAAPVEPDGRSLLDKIRAMGYRLVPLPSFREACPYALVGMDPGLARSAFRLERDRAAEARLLDAVRAEVGLAYVVVHDDEDRRVRPGLLPGGLPVVRVRDPRWRTDSLFDWVQVLDNAVQLHAVDSCVLLLADFLDLKARRYRHAYVDALAGRHAHRDTVVIWG